MSYSFELGSCIPQFSDPARHHRPVVVSPNAGMCDHWQLGNRNVPLGYSHISIFNHKIALNVLISWLKLSNSKRYIKCGYEPFALLETIVLVFKYLSFVFSKCVGSPGLIHDRTLDCEPVSWAWLHGLPHN